MKRERLLFTILLVATINLFGETAASPDAEPVDQIIVVRVEGMVCAFCAQGIDRSLSKVESVDGILINLKHSLVAVSEEKGFTVSDEDLKAIITDAGFSVVSLERRDGTLQALRKEFEEKEP